MRRKSTTTSRSRRGSKTSARQSDGSGAFGSAARALLEIAQEASELDEQDEGDEHAERGQPAVVEHVVGERRRPDRRRHEREQEHGLRLREAVVDEPMRRVVQAALRDRPSLHEPRDRHQRRIEDRDREHEQGEQDRRGRRPGDGPARASASDASPKPSTWLPESPMKTTAPRRGRRLKGRNPAHAAEREGEHEHVLLSCSVNASIAKYPQETTASVAARPSMLSSRLNAFVIPTSQRSPIAHARTSLPTISTLRPLASTMTAAPICAASFAMGSGDGGRRRARPQRRA